MCFLGIYATDSKSHEDRWVFHPLCVRPQFLLRHHVALYCLLQYIKRHIPGLSLKKLKYITNLIIIPKTVLDQWT